MTDAMTSEEAITAIAEAGKTKLKNIIVEELQEINLKVAAIAGWENVQPWRKDSPTLVGTNTNRPEIGKYVPVYTKDQSAIYDVLTRYMRALGSSFGCQFVPGEFYSPSSRPHLAYGLGITIYEATPALALCKLLLAIAKLEADKKDESE